MLWIEGFGLSGTTYTQGKRMMSKKTEQDYTLAVAIKMKIDVDTYIRPNGSYENITYDVVGMDEKIKSLNPQVFDLKARYFLAKEKIKDNEDKSKNKELKLAKDNIDRDLYILVNKYFGK